MKRMTRLAVLCHRHKPWRSRAGQEIKDVFGVPVYPGRQARRGDHEVPDREHGRRGQGVPHRRSRWPRSSRILQGEGIDGDHGRSEEGAMFKKGDNVDVTLQNPWQNMQIRQDGEGNPHLHRQERLGRARPPRSLHHGAEERLEGLAVDLLLQGQDLGPVGTG
ncbi:MAG: hypothetical protein MZU91_10775 [Desulfosudis oleivorans]|nr:hypothetical protein [Desulfosudis oleivorans]